MKRGLGKGSWRSSKEFRESTRIMDRLIWFTKNIRLQPINNQQGQTTSMYDHFITEEEKTRLERDTKTKEVSHADAHRVISFRFMPQIVKTEENIDLLQEYIRLTEEFVELSERVTKPCNCLCGRTSCKCCFTSLFGETKQMG